MKERNPLFVGGFPYSTFFIGYAGMQIISAGTEEGAATPGTSTLIGLLAAMTLVFIGGIYALYWLIDTAKVLRRETNEKIPHGILLIIPFANFWWMWRYSQAAGVYTKEKPQGVVAFILLALLGAIGMGVLQDAYNKTGKSSS